MVQRQALRSTSKGSTKTRQTERSSKSPTRTNTKKRQSAKVVTKKLLDEDKSSDEFTEVVRTSKIITRKSAPVPENKEKDESSSDDVSVTRRVTRRSARLVEKENEEVCVISSDEEVIEEKKPKPVKLVSKNRFIVRRMFGILMVLVSVLLLPCIVVFLNKMTENGGQIRPIKLNEIKIEYFSHCKSIGALVIWLLFLFVTAFLPIGWLKAKRSEVGIIRFRCNGIISLLISLVVFGVLYHYKYAKPAMFIQHYYEIIGSSIVLSFLIAVFIFLKSFINNKTVVVDSKESAATGFLIGRELNPSLFKLDVRFFYEFRPGIITWAIISLIYIVSDMENKGFKSVNMSLLFLTISQFVYCLDALIFEGDLVSKTFIYQGRFGFIHCFGNQVVVPFLFTLTTRAVYLNKLQLPINCLAGIAFCNLIGYTIFRTSNWQKNSFRSNPYSTNLSHLKTLTNDKGRQLLLGGWWAWLRHPNYLGDLIMCLCWSFYSGIHTSICWVYPLYFTIFIISRCIQDNRICQLKHGYAWTEYSKTVKYKLVPFIY